MLLLIMVILNILSLMQSVDDKDLLPGPAGL